MQNNVIQQRKRGLSVLILSVVVTAFSGVSLLFISGISPLLPYLANVEISSSKSRATEEVMRHSAIVSPERKHLYDGIVTLDEDGEAAIVLPGHFFGRTAEHRVFATPIGEPMPQLQVRIDEKHRWLGFWRVPVLTIKEGPPAGRVSWQVTANQ